MNVFNVNADVQDVEVLLGNVSKALEQWEGGKALPLDLSIMLGEADQASQRAGRLKGQWNLNSWAIIHSTRPGVGSWIIRFQHIVRKVTWWYLEPIIQQIRSFQMNAALVLDQIAQSQEELLAHAQMQAAEMAELRQRVAALETRLGEERAHKSGTQASDAG